MTTLTAVLNAYSISVGLDNKATTMAKLQSTWSQIEKDRRQLWNHWYEEDAEAKLREIEGRDADASQLGITEAPYNRKVLKKWERFVDQQYAPVAAQEPVAT